MGRSDGYNARGCMWDRLIPELIFMNYHERKLAKRAYAEERGLKPFDFNPMPEDELKAMQYISNSTNAPASGWKPFAIQDLDFFAPLNEVCVYEQKKETTMSYNDHDEYETPIQTRTDETKKRDYLHSRLDDVSSEKRTEAREMFHMDADQPTALKELVEKIQAGKFTPLSKDAERQYAGSVYHIDWHDPATPADPVGYRAARDAFKALKTKTMDAIAISEPAEALTALQALEAWTPTGAAN